MKKIKFPSMKKIRIIVRGYEHKSVDKAIAQIISVCRSAGSKIKGPVPLPTRKEVSTVLRGVFRHKDSREQFERNEHKRLIVVGPNSKTMDSLKVIQLPSSVSFLIKTKNT